MALTGSYHGRVERSVFAAFLLLTVIPLTAIGLFTIWQINTQTLDRAKIEQKDTAKAYGLTLMQRIADLAHQAAPLIINDEVAQAWFDNHWMIKEVATPPDPVVWSGDRPVLVKQQEDYFLGIPTEGRLFWVMIDPHQWWFDLGEVPNENRLCVLIDDRSVACGEEPSGEEVIRTIWPLFLESGFEANFKLAISADQPRSKVLSATSLMSRILPALTVLTCVVIALLGSVLIKRKFRPLSALQKATLAIEQGDYEHRIGVESTDEFGQLGEAFNRMTSRLEESFSTMKLLADVDRLMLSSPRIETIIERVLQVSLSWPQVRSVWVVLGTSAQPEKLHLHQVDKNGKIVSSKVSWDQLLVDRNWDLSVAEVVEITGLPLTRYYQVHCDGQVAGALFLQSVSVEQDTLPHLKDMADRLSVATTNLRHAQNLFHQAHFDNLTGLLNRNAFSDRLSQAVAHAIRTGSAGALVYIDLDRFKQVNDTEGHKAGDRLLKVIGTRLSGVLREVDSLARLGGDEFGLVLPAMGNEVEIIAVCERILREIEKPVAVENTEHSIGASIGIALFPGDGEDAEALLMRADAAMYHSKEGGGGRYTFFDQRINDANHRRVTVEVRLRKAVERQALRLVFQPKFELATNRIVSGEALMRWTDSILGVVNPEEFISVAESTGLIHAIEPILTDQALDMVGLCQKHGCPIEHIAINASPRQITSGGFAQRLISQIVARGFSPSQLQVEVTESLFINDSEQVRGELRSLRQSGASIALDDFGTGFSSLNMLTQIPLDVIKIDRAFLLPMETSAQSRALLKHIISIAITLGKKVVAEGVEEHKQMQFLKESGCHYAQGYLISKPLEAEEFVNFVLTHNAAIDQKLNQA
ncbi:MAG: EAL domain-containing protein [Proteobacteria bacterium]|nr:EAL domain-containing protein [Pseudomonadota bacterium]